ncbi:MAG: MCP four helix bundle domain-containing protein [Nitrospinales bacterium]
MGLLKNLKIGQRLALGFGLIIVLIGILGYEAINNLKLLSGLTNKLHKHPLTVSNATLEISGDIVRIHRSMKDVALAKNEEQLVKAWNTANSYEKPVYDNFALVNERFLGDKTNVNEAKQAFADWKAIREEVYQFMQSGERDKAAAITKGKGAKHVADMNNKIDYLVNFAKTRRMNF